MTHAGVFAHPFLYWVGMDTDPRTPPEALAEFNRFYSTTHVHEVVAAHPGFVSVSRYELLDQDPRGDVHAGPRWLAVYEMADEASAEQYIKDNARPWLHRRRYSPWPPARKRAKTVWRMIWRRLSATGSTDQLPESVMLVGMNPAADADAGGLDEFNAFYTQTHVPEVMVAGGYARGTRFELYREFAHPAPGCPRFCAVYEADTAATEEHAARRAARAPLSSGPPAWDKRESIWRLLYRRIPPPD
jgi:Phage related protein